MGLLCILHPLHRTLEWGLAPPLSTAASRRSRGARGLWRQNAVEKPVPRQFGERRRRGSRGRRELRLGSRPSVSFPSFPAPPGSARRLDGEPGPPLQMRVAVKERAKNEETSSRGTLLPVEGVPDTHPLPQDSSPTGGGGEKPVG